VNKFLFSISVGLAFSSLMGWAAEPTSTKAARAEIINAKGEKIGTADFAETPQGVLMSLDVTQLKFGTHGFHIHETGKCIGPDFKSAGGHFNPEGKEHGFETSKGIHAGDLPNLKVQGNGKGTIELFIQNVTLKGGKNSLLKEGGTSLVIHEKADDYRSSPAGDSGGRIACGVIQAR
jgi:superoxide dismutase, Cu-Zn family